MCLSQHLCACYIPRPPSSPLASPNVEQIGKTKRRYPFNALNIVQSNLNLKLTTGVKPSLTVVLNGASKGGNLITRISFDDKFMAI